MQLCELGVDLKREDDAVGFLGVTLEWDSEMSLLEMTQTGLIKRIIKALGLDNGGLVQAWVAQKTHKRDILRVFTMFNL